MKILFINPNSTAEMTRNIAASAAEVLPGHQVLGWTNPDGPPSIQGSEDGEAAVPGLLSLLPRAKAEAVEAIVIACFDDTGLNRARALAHCPVIGIGEAAFHAAGLLGTPFSVVTTLSVSLPVIESNIDAYGFRPLCRRVRASGVPVLELEGSEASAMDRISAEITRVEAEDDASAVILGCAGMAKLGPTMRTRHAIRILDGVEAAGLLAVAAARLGALTATGRVPAPAGS